MKFIVIGLGNYGETLARRLTEMGHEIIGADNDAERVQSLSNALAGTICLDARKVNAIESLPLSDADAVIVAIGKDFAVSVQTVARLKQLGVKNIIARGLNPLHVGVLQTLGVNRVTFPENVAAEILAQSLSLPEFQSSYKLDPTHYIFQIGVPKSFIGKSVQDLELAVHGLQLITIKAPTSIRNILGQTHTETRVVGTPSDTTQLTVGDLLVVYGSIADYDAFTRSLR